MARPRKEIDPATIAEAVKRGASLATIAREHDVAQNTIRRRIRETHGGLTFAQYRDLQRNLPRT